MAIDTAAERDDACHCRDAVSVPGPKLGITYHFSDCRVDTITGLCDEVDRLRAALADIAAGECGDLVRPPCPPDDRCDVCTARAALDGQEADQ